MNECMYKIQEIVAVDFKNLKLNVLLCFFVT
jgi:hypothetical protein